MTDNQIKQLKKGDAILAIPPKRQLVRGTLTQFVPLQPIRGTFVEVVNPNGEVLIRYKDGHTGGIRLTFAKLVSVDTHPRAARRLRRKARKA